jgi:hypothetical protein
MHRSTVWEVANAGLAGTHPRLSDHAAAFLSTEHWGLLSARSLAWNETFNRVSVFLNTLSASAVALALVADASGFDDQFKIFALILFPIVLFLGLATYVRVVQINLEDIYLVGAMNRLRRAYVDSAPEVREYFTSGVSDDEAGIWASYLLGRPHPRPRAQLLATTPTLVATLDAVIATVGAGALTIHLGGSGRPLGRVVPRGLPVLLGRALYAPAQGIQDSAPERGSLSVAGHVKG